MAANSNVGNVNSMKILSTDSLGNKAETTINTSRLFVNPAATYQQVDAFARALMGTSTNTYNDTNLITVISVNEILAE